MTRANFVIITPQGKYKFQGNSSCYPSNIMDSVLRFSISTASTNLGATNGFYSEPESNSLSKLIDDVGLTLGHVGNPSYFYEIDFIKQTVSVWDYKLSWINAPLDWQEKGWSCWIGKNGKYGYSNFVKGKKIYNKSFADIKDNLLAEIILAESL